MQKQGEHKSTKITMQQNHVQKKTISAHEFLTCIDETAWLQLTAADTPASKQVCRIARSKLMLLLHLVPHRNGHVCCSASQVAVLHLAWQSRCAWGVVHLNSTCAYTSMAHMTMQSSPECNVSKLRTHCKQAKCAQCAR